LWRKPCGWLLRPEQTPGTKSYLQIIGYKMLPFSILFCPCFYEKSWDIPCLADALRKPEFVMTFNKIPFFTQKHDLLQ
jgi:hypothetical protein